MANELNIIFFKLVIIYNYYKGIHKFIVCECLSCTMLEYAKNHANNSAHKKYFGKQNVRRQIVIPLRYLFQRF